MPYKKLIRSSFIAALLSIIVWSIILTQCVPSAPYIEWEYIIPDNYTGYLAIRYNCPGGSPLVMQDKSIRINFNSDGTYCTSNVYSASWSSNNRSFNTSGTPIPIAFSPWNQQGYAVCCGSTQVMSDTAGVNYGKDIVLFLQWVGEMTLVLASWPSMPTGADDFFAEIGLQDPDNLFKTSSTRTAP